MVMDASRRPQRGGRISLLVDPERTTLVRLERFAGWDLHSQKQSAHNCFGEDRLAVRRLRVPVGKAQNLKTAGITDDPEIQLVPFPVSRRNFDKARQTSLFFDGSIDAR